MEMVWNLLPNETPKTDLILSRMSEADICLLTGDKGNLISIPVDFNTNNMLPTNMVCLSRDIVDAIEYVYKYRVHCTNGITITLYTPECFVEYNKNLIQIIGENIPKTFIEIYEYLMLRHVKGISEITLEDESSMDWAALQRYWFSKLDKMKNKKWKIITPESFN